MQTNKGDPARNANKQINKCDPARKHECKQMQM